MATVLEDLKAVRELLTSSEKWCRKAYAKDAQGHCLFPWDEAAVSYCLTGAVSKVTFSQNQTTIFSLLASSFDELTTTSKLDADDCRERLVTFNDRPETKHEHILICLDKVIKYVQEHTALEKV